MATASAVIGLPSTDFHCIQGGDRSRAAAHRPRSVEALSAAVAQVTQSRPFEPTILLSETGRPFMPAVARVEASGSPLESPWVGIRPARRSTGTTDRPTCGSEVYEFQDGVARLIRRLFDRFRFFLSRWCGRCSARASATGLTEVVGPVVDIENLPCNLGGVGQARKEASAVKRGDQGRRRDG